MILNIMKQKELINLKYGFFLKFKEIDKFMSRFVKKNYY